MWTGCKVWMRFCRKWLMLKSILYNLIRVRYGQWQKANMRFQRKKFNLACWWSNSPVNNWWNRSWHFVSKHQCRKTEKRTMSPQGLMRFRTLWWKNISTWITVAEQKPKLKHQLNTLKQNLEWRFTCETSSWQNHTN